MVGDPTAAKPKPRFRTRPDKEICLQDLIANFPDVPDYMAALQSLDDDDKRKTSGNRNRNRSSHALGPQIEIGLIEKITRTVFYFNATN